MCVAQVDGNSTTLSMSVHFKQLKRLVEEPTFSQILIPLQSVLIPTLPSTGGANTKHDAFPGHWAYLDGFDDSVRETHEYHLVKNVVHNSNVCVFLGGDLGLLTEAKEDKSEGF